MSRKSNFPHFGVYTRIKRSKVDKNGVGVFAIRSIKKGTNIFSTDTAKMVPVDGKQIKRLPKEIKKLYEDFCVIKKKKNGKTYLCPRNFNVLTVAWYINDSDDPNVRCDKYYDFFALRNIRAGEELTAEYSTYSDED